MEHCKENVLNELKNTFPNVKMLLYSTSPFLHEKINSMKIKLNETFPNTVSLLLEHTKQWDWQIICEGYRNLTLLYVDIPQTMVHGHPIEMVLATWLEKHRNIEVFSVQQSTQYLLKKANQIFKQLKILDLRFLSDEYLI